MDPTVSIVTFLIALPACFLGGLLNAISGGGFITVPALLLAGLPAHYALSTDKIQSFFGMATASFRFIKNGLIYWKVILPAIPAALVGSACGTSLVVLVDANLLSWLLMIILPVVAYITLSKRFNRAAADNSDEPITVKQRILCVVAAFVIGAYDGFYGPGSGTFLTIAFTFAASMGIIRANAHSKLLNLTTNIGAIIVFALNGKVLLVLAIACGIANMIGAWFGAGLVMKKGINIAKPCILIALGLLAVKLIGEQLGFF